MALKILRRRDPKSVFPAHYDRCRYSELRGLLRQWSEPHVIPQPTGALYFELLRPLQAMYLGYE
jgi:hypothetical protein